MKSVILFAAAAVALTPAVRLEAAPLRVHGSSTVHHAILEPHLAEIEADCGFALEVVPNGSGHGVNDLLSGKSEVAMISSALPSVLSGLYQDNPPPAAADLRVFLIDEIEACLIVHPSNPVQSVKAAEAAALLAGEFPGWGPLGGLSQPVMVVTMIAGDGVRSTVESELLKEFRVGFSPAARKLASANDAPSVVAENPLAIGITSFDRVTPAVRVLPIGRPIVQRLQIVTLGAPSPEATRLIEVLRAY